MVSMSPLSACEPRLIVRSLLADRGRAQIDVRRLDPMRSGLDLISAERVLGSHRAARAIGATVRCRRRPPTSAVSVLGWLPD